MELYKKHEVSPFRSIGILLIQLPIFIALYMVIQIMTLSRGEIGKYTYDFLENIPVIGQIVSHPENFSEKLFGFVDLTQHAFSKGNLDLVLVFLAIVAAITQFIMSKQTMPTGPSKRTLREIFSDASAGKEADQSEINTAIMGKMMYVLPFFMLVLMLNLPGALALYYAVSNIVATIQQHFILKQDEHELEEIASEPKQVTPAKKATAKARAKGASEATVTKIVAKDNGKKPKKK